MEHNTLTDGCKSPDAESLYSGRCVSYLTDIFESVKSMSVRSTETNDHAILRLFVKSSGMKFFQLIFRRHS